MFKGMGNIQQLMKEAQKMSEKMAEAKERLAKEEVSASSGGGMVEATVNGNFQLLRLTIDPEIIQDGDIEMIQDLVKAAVNEATRVAQDKMNEELKGMTGGLPIPGLGF